MFTQIRNILIEKLLKEACESDKYSPVRNSRITLQLEIISIFFLF